MVNDELAKIEKVKRVFRSISLFSQLVIGFPLRQYQIDPADAVIESCVHNRGIEFLWVFPRQSGKDEAVAQMLAYLLSMFHRTEAQMIHVYPTQMQTATGVTRLERRLDNILTRSYSWSKNRPKRIGVERSQCYFFSGHEQSRAEGATANLLLVVNEVQDCDEVVIERRFTPMRASTNASALFVGTVRTTSDYLWRVKTRLEKLEAKDGIKRVWFVSPGEVGKENMFYQQFVHNQILMKGRQHPSVKSELFNEPVDTAAGLFPDRRLALMRGRHVRQAGPSQGEVYVAMLDVGGQDEAATEAFSDLDNPGRDYTVLTICRVNLDGASSVGPTYEVVDVFTDQGSRHFQSFPGKPSLFDRLLALLDHWRPVATVVDMSGVGQGVTDALIEQHSGAVFGFDFSKNHGKARLGNDFLAIVETGRFKYFEGGGEGSDSWWFFTQAEFCGYELAEGVPIERGLRWGVRAGVKTQLSAGGVIAVHDDRLLSAALVAHVEELRLDGKIFFSTGESAIISITDREDQGWN